MVASGEIEARSMSDRPWREKETLRRLYAVEGLSSLEVADRLDCSKPTVLRWLHEYDISVRPPKKERPPNFQTGPGGRERIKCQVNGVQHSVLHHRLIAVAECGFDAVADSIVHHKSGVSWDNRPGNLELVDNQKEHFGRHHGDFNSKLTPDDVREIRRRRADGENGYKLADEFGVSDKTIYSAERGDTFGWVSDD